MTFLRRNILAVLLAGLLPIFPAAAQNAVPANDTLNAVLWMQRSVEYKANTQAVFALAKIRLNQALADKSWTAAPAEQTGQYKSLPPAIVTDVDETLLDNSAYQAWNVAAGTTFGSDTWTQFVKAEISTAIPGALEFTKYAAANGVKVFYVTNRTKEEEDATQDNMKKLGFPMGGNVDTLLTNKEKPDWTSAKGTRRAVVAKGYRILLCLGDNLGDFTDAYKGSEADRLKIYQDNAARWSHDWIMLPNPTYGSFEAAPYDFNYKLPADEQRAAKVKVLTSWKGY